MKKEKRTAGKRRGAHLLSLSFIISSFLFVLGCEHPLSIGDNADIPAGKGAFSLTLSQDRTVAPTAPTKNDFAVYELTFTPQDGDPVVEERTNATISTEQIILDPGTYNLAVNAYKDSAKTKLLAQGTLNGVVIIVGQNTSRTVTLKALLSGGAGTFSWNIKFPANVTVASMKITPANAGGTPEQTVTLIGAGAIDSRILNSGYYSLFINLESPIGKVKWFELLYVYLNLESHFTFNFTEPYFINDSYTVTYHYNDGVTAGLPQSVLHGTKVIAPASPNKDGFIFGGWFTDDGTFASLYNFNTMVINSFNLYANWEIDPNYNPPADPDPVITYTVEQFGGVDANTATTAITFTFDENIDRFGLTAADITVGAGNGFVTAGDFTGSGTSWSLEITTVNTPGYITITIFIEGIENETKIVPLVYHPTIPAPTITGILVEPDAVIIVPMNTTLEQLKHYLTVTAHYSDGVDYMLSNGDYALSGGPLTFGTYTITVNFEGETASVTVKTADITYTVEQIGGIDADTDSIGLKFTFSAGIDSYSLTAADIIILPESTADIDTGMLIRNSETEWVLAITEVRQPGYIILQIPGKDGIDDEPHHVAIVYDDIINAPTITVDAVYAQRGVLYPDTPFDNLKNTLMVKLLYDGQSPQMMSRSEYTLSGVLTVPTSTMTVNAQGFTSTFTVTIASRYTAVQTGGATNTTDSDGILLTFEANIDGVGLIADDITVKNGTGEVTKGGLTRISGTVWKLAITDVATDGNVTVIITKKIGALPVIEAAAKTVAVYKGVAQPNPITLAIGTPSRTLIPFDSADTQYGTTATFNVTVSGLLGSDTITINLAANSHGLSLSNNTGISGSGTITLNYDGTTAVAQTTALSVGLTISGDGNYALSGSPVVTPAVIDGQATARAIPVTQANIAAFNTYANTTNGASRHYKLIENVTLPAVFTGSNWTAIGGENDPSFTGSFDGQGNTITNLTINAAGDYMGMFGYIETSGVVQRLGLINCNVSGTTSISAPAAGVGGVAGGNLGVIQNCSVSGSVSSDYATGGVVGTNWYTGIVQSCYTSGSVSASSGVVGNAGGVAGENYGTIRYCYASGSVSGSSIFEGSNVGGVVGMNNDGTVQNCYATANVTSDFYAGGVAGNGSVQNCYATGNVSGAIHAGGVTGTSEGIVQNCYATGSVISTGINMYSRSGGVVGFLDGYYGTATVQNCVALNTSVTWVNPTDESLGRVIGHIWNSSPTNNYARNNLDIRYHVNNDVGGTAKLVTSSTTGVDGMDITATEWNDAAWWENTALFPSTAWEFRNGLPILKNMPNGIQNPVIPLITYTVIQEGGEDGVSASQSLLFTVASGETLSNSDITITDGTGSILRDSFLGVGQNAYGQNMYRVDIFVYTTGDLTVTVNKAGVDDTAKTVTVYSGPSLVGTAKTVYFWLDTVNNVMTATSTLIALSKSAGETVTFNASDSGYTLFMWSGTGVTGNPGNVSSYTFNGAIGSPGSTYNVSLMCMKGIPRTIVFRVRVTD